MSLSAVVEHLMTGINFNITHTNHNLMGQIPVIWLCRGLRIKRCIAVYWSLVGGCERPFLEKLSIGKVLYHVSTFQDDINLAESGKGRWDWLLGSCNNRLQGAAASIYRWRTTLALEFFRSYGKFKYSLTWRPVKLIEIYISWFKHSY